MIVAGDMETYYDRDYSLTKMTVVEYVLDPRFQVIMLSIKVDDQPCEILIGHEQVAGRLAQLDWDNVAWLSHNVNFDAAILRWVFGYEPALFLCTLSMARATTHWVLGKSSLASVSKYLGLPPKGDEVVRALGKRLEAFTHDELRSYAAYCIRDNENARAIFDRLRSLFSNTELRVIDLVARMHVLPQVKLNAYVLAEHLAAVQSEKQQALDAVGHLPPSVFSSQLQFAALLEEHGVEVPTKKSPTTGKLIHALARNDREFRELCEDPELPVQVQALLAARLQVKSTLEETRCSRMLQIAQLRWPDGTTGWLPAPLKYSAARTHRLGGDDKLNVQNLRRGSRIREAVEAPPGFRIVHRDSSQIEARMVAWMSRCRALLDAFEERRDVYCEFASSIYGTTVTPEDKLRRFVGKTSILGLGYGCGPVKFRHMLFIGNGGISLKVDEYEAKRIVYHYRSMYREIPQLWTTASATVDLVIERSHRETPPSSWLHGCIGKHVPIKIGHDSIWLPNGLCLSYPELHYERDDTTHTYESYYKNAYGGMIKLYGAKLVENLSQALARIIVTDIAVRMYDETGYHPFLSTHDSLTYCVPTTDVAWWDRRLTQEFSIVPSWATGLPLASEGGWGCNMLAAERAVND